MNFLPDEEQPKTLGVKFLTLEEDLEILETLLREFGGPPGEEALDLSELGPFESNYVAAMIETTCVNRNIPAPSWLSKIAPLADPWFATSLTSLRVHLLISSPPPFRRRNLYIDSTLGARV